MGYCCEIEILNEFVAEVEIINSGINSEPCPIIICIDGGDAATASYPAVNGLINGGTA